MALAQVSLSASHLQPAGNGNEGAISLTAGLFPSQKVQFQPVGFFPRKQKQLEDNYTKRQEPGTHTPDDQVKQVCIKMVLQEIL